MERPSSPDVQHHEVDPRRLHRLGHGAAVGGSVDAKAVLLEEAAQQVADLGVVVDDQDVRRAFHASTICIAPHGAARKSCNRR